MNQSKQHIFLILILSFVTVVGIAQDDEGMLLLEDSDDIRIKFENHYYEALKYKATGNYSRAITELEKCQKLDANNASVAFEFSKNYFLLSKYNESELYIEKALQFENENYWFLEQAKKVYLKQYNYTKAIGIQEEIMAQRPAKKEDLVLLYILANEREKAQIILDELEAQGIRSLKLRNYQKAILNYKKNATSKKNSESKNISLIELKERFKTEKQFEILKQILILDFANGNNEELIKYSDEGLALFPAQPLVYLMQGRSLNIQKNYKEAIDVLNMGLDFIIDDNFLQADFYEVLSESYKGLNVLEKSEEFKFKSDQLRKNK